MKSRKNLTLAVISALLILTGCGGPPRTASSDMPETYFTTAVPLKTAGCPNFHKVSDDLYRGAQPKDGGFKKLERLGIKTIVDLRSPHSEDEKISGTSLNYINIPMKATSPDQKAVERFLDVMADPANHPVFLHCKHGSDRTGMTVAVYRMVFEGWSKDRAIDEMRDRPFGFHEIFFGLPRFLDKLDIASLCQKFQPTLQVVYD